MATTMRPVLCPHCGAQVRKNGYCSECYLPLSMLKKAQNTSNYYYNIGYDRASARDLSGAIESLLQALRYNKRNVPARNLLGLIYYEMGEAVQASPVGECRSACAEVQHGNPVCAQRRL